MENSNKILIVIFTILFVVLVGEVGYIFFSQKLPFNLGSNNGNKNTLVSPEPNKQTILPEKDDMNGTQALSDDTIDNITRLNKNILTTSTMVTNFYGNVVEVDKTNGLRLKLRGETDKTGTISYAPEEVGRIEFLMYKEGSKPLPATIDDIKEGRILIIKQSLDLMRDLTNQLQWATILIKP